jgi:hypothetical protein
VSWATSGIRSRRAARWIALFGIALVLALPISYVDWVHLREDTPPWALWQAAVVFLMAVEAGYLAALVFAVIGAMVFGRVVWSARRRGASRPAAARLLLVCTSILASLILAESVCALWMRLSGQSAPTPAAVRASLTNGASTKRLAPFATAPNLPSDFADPPGDSDIDLVVLGESSAQGVPFQQWVSIGRLVAWKMEEALRGRTVRLRIVARSGDTLERQHQALADLDRRPDLLILYCGHNEFQSRFFAWRDPEHYFVDGQPSAFVAMLDPVERLSPLCGLIKREADQCRVGIPPPPDRQREPVDVPVYTPGEYRALLDDFRWRVESIVVYAEKVGALPVLILPAANDASFEPNRSYLPPTTSRGQREALRQEFLALRRSESSDPGESIARYRDILIRFPGFAEAHYRLARLFERTEDWNRAYEHYVAARDFDGYPMRCLSEFQAVYRDVAAHHRCILIDTQAYFHAIGRRGLLDDELFQDAMHPSLRGQIALAQAVLTEMSLRRAFGWPASSAPPVIDPSECARRFHIGVPEWKALCKWQAGFNRLVLRLRYEDSERRRRIASAEAAAQKLDQGVAAEALGLPNFGIPAPVPLTKIETSSSLPAAHPRG